MAAPRRRSSTRGRSSARSSSAEESRSSRSGTGNRSSRSRGRSSGGAATATPRRSADGKVPVACPRCAAKYNVPEDYLDTVVTCKHCHSTFTPRNAMGHAPRPKRGAGAGGSMLKVGFIALPFVLFVIIWNANKKEKPKPPPIVTNPTLQTTDEAFRVFADFLIAVEKRNPQPIDIGLDWERFWNKSGDKSKSKNWDLLAPPDKKTFKNTFTEDLFTMTPVPEPTASAEERKKAMEAPARIADVFREYTMDNMQFNDSIDFPDETKELRYSVDIFHKERITLGNATVSAHVVKDGNIWKIAGWTIDSLPKRFPKRKKMRHRAIKPPKWKEVVVKGKKMKQYQTDIVPLEHLDDTPGPLRKEIDRLIDIVYTESENPKDSIRASSRLVEIGKAAVPRILNSFYERKGENRVEVEGMNILVKSYNNITGGNIAFLPDLDPNAVFGGTNKDREVLLKTAYAHWYFNYWKKEEDLQGDTDEELDKDFDKGTGARPGRKRR